MSFKTDFHTHSIASHDGGITEVQYKKTLVNGVLDFIAVTDHNRIDFALSLKKKLGNKIIVGEEIMTTEGEIIGLFLTKVVEPWQSPEDTVKKIKQQGGTVYIPHPFESVRNGLSIDVLNRIAKLTDIIETFNGRAFLQKRHAQATLFAEEHSLSTAASSDAHGVKALGKTYTLTAKQPTKTTLVTQLANAKLVTKGPSPRDLLYPKYNKFLKILKP